MGEFFRINVEGGTFAIAKTTRPAVTGTHYDGTAITTFFFDSLEGAGITITGATDKAAGGASFDFISRMTVGTTLASQSGTNNGFITWKYAENFDDELPDTSFGAAFNGATNDLVHTIVVDEDGKWTGTKETFLKGSPHDPRLQMLRMSKAEVCSTRTPSMKIQNIFSGLSTLMAQLLEPEPEPLGVSPLTLAELMN